MDYDPLPENFRKSAAALVNFNFTDVASGTGYVTFYAADDSAASSYFLTNSSSIYSNAGSTIDTETNGTYLLNHDIDFDIAFNLPQIVKGDFIVNVPLRVSYGAGTSADSYSVAEIIHFDGSTETSLGTAGASANSHNVPASTTDYFIDAHKINVTKKQFKSTDTLRLNIKIYMRTNGGGTNTTSLGHDPTNRGTLPAEDWSSNVTQLSMQVPFQVEI